MRQHYTKQLILLSKSFCDLSHSVVCSYYLIDEWKYGCECWSKLWVLFCECWLKYETLAVRWVFWGVTCEPGCGLARPVNIVVLDEPARYKNRLIVPCLGRSPGPRAWEARPAGHSVPCQPDPHRAVPAHCPSIPNLSLRFFWHF